MPELKELKKQLESTEAAIAEAKARMPAHSAKPEMMTELIELEDQRDKLLDQIAQAENKGAAGSSAGS